MERSIKHRLLAIEGNIGSGKTSLATRLAEDYGARLILEQFADNPFLPKFYEDPEQYAFPLELFFMAERYQQLKSQIAAPNLFEPFIVSDYMFTKSLLFAHVTLKSDEYLLYQRLFQIINPQLPRPDLIVYLYASIPRLLANIARRGRPYEQNIRGEYLEKLQQTYLEYFRHHSDLPVLIVDVSKADFVNKREEYEAIRELIEKDYGPGMHEARIG